jgi:A/G-specific adenine glycosylase
MRHGEELQALLANGGFGMTWAAMPATLAKPLPTGKSTPHFAGPDPIAAETLLAWYRRHARRLPWRVGPADRARGLRPDPYRVWLSEVMLQQTTVKAVQPYFLGFLERWPSLQALAAAPEHEVMAAWAGLGYYSRARNLIACARAVAAGRGGRFPASAAELALLPGIGVYTSAAIAAIAFDERVAVVDGNVERVVSRLTAIEEPPPAAKAIVRETLQLFVPADRPGEFAEALMDLGATICTPKRPACTLCPWFDLCLARRQGRQLELPVKAARRERPTRYGIAYVARRQDGAILLRRRPPNGLLGGMSEPPGSPWTTARPDAVEPPLDADWRAAATPVTHGFTHFELRLSVLKTEVDADVPAPDGHWWAAAGTLSREALPTVMKKAVEAAYPGATKPARTET